MSLPKCKYDAYVSILKEELVPALGCTEPISIAYAAAKARQLLGERPASMVVHASGNLIKNVKGVFIPGGGNLRGIDASALLGMVGGDPELGLEVLSGVTEEDIETVRGLLEKGFCRTEVYQTKANLHMLVEVVAGERSASVEIMHTHMNIVRMVKNGETVFEKTCDADNFNAALTDRSVLNLRDIYEFANTVKLADVREMIGKQIDCNMAIANEGLSGDWGAGVGRMLMNRCRGDLMTKLKAYAAAGSDARMSGCILPVITCSGSGNQGMTTSLPVIVYAREKGLSEDKLYRALVLSNLVAIHQKTGIGRLSAYCGAVCAATGSGAALTYLDDGTFEQIEKTVVNSIADVSGIVCDGAKPSCAAKIASSLDAAIMGHYLAMEDHTFDPETGIVKESAEETIQAVGRLGREGMRGTDEEILKIMTGK